MHNLCIYLDLKIGLVVTLEVVLFFNVYFLLEYSCFTMLCYFLLYSKMNQPYIYTYPLSFGRPFFQVTSGH